MTSDRIRDWVLPIVLLTAHTLLLETATAIELNDAWNDQNASLLVALTIPVVDAPVAWAVRPLVDSQSQPGTYYLLLKVLGGAFWFGVGWLATLVFRSLAVAPSHNEGLG